MAVTMSHRFDQDKQSPQCTALLFAAIESAHTGQPVDVQEFLARHPTG